MAKILIIDKFGNSVIKKSCCIPRVGDHIDINYKPLPQVTGVIFWPNLDDVSYPNGSSIDDIDVLLTLG